MKVLAASPRRDYAYKIFTPPIKHLYAKSIVEANRKVLGVYRENPEQFKYAQNDKRGSTSNLRFFLSLCFQSNFAQVDSVKFRKHNGYLKIQHGITHIVQFVKADFPDTPMRTSKQFAGCENLELPLIFAEENSEPPFDKMTPITIRVVLREDTTVGECYLCDQVNGVVKSYEQLDLSLGAFSLPADDDSDDKDNPFKWQTG